MMMSLLGLQSIDAVSRHPSSSSSFSQYVNRARRFVDFLIEEGIAQPTASVSTSPTNDRVRTFQSWLRQHRGLSERTIDRHGRMIMRLLPALGDNPASYDAGLVRRVILAETQRSSRPYVKTMTTALRGYLNFLAAHGECRPWLDRAIPISPTMAAVGAAALPSRRRRRAADLIL